jgi:XTP/dITP diphosphohydrolase
MQEKAANVGFDWDNKEDVWAKVHEEIDEIQIEMQSGDKAKMEKEFGDLLFSLVNVARHHGINPDNALEQTNNKFRSRFNYVEQNTIKQGRNLREMSLEEMDALWNEAKRCETET